MRRAVLLLFLLATACESSPRRPSVIIPARDSGVSSTADGSTNADASSGSGDASTQPGDGGSVARDAGSTTTDAGVVPDAGHPPDAGRAPDAGVPGGPYCRQTCTSPADCSQNSAPFDADNYACLAGVCEYQGCNGDAECTTAFGAGYVCRAVAGNTVRSCYAACSTAADCTQPNVLYDADNYRCTSGACEWTGCNNAAECRDAFADPGYTCAPQPGLSFMNCIRTCTNAGQCVSPNAPPAFDADNYICNGSGLCEYDGCNSPQECSASFPSGTWTCR